MTPISELTNAELDELIAKLRGWKQDEDNPIEAWKIFWIPPDKDGKVSEYLLNCPSPTTDPHYAMELLEEMMESDILIRLGNGDGDSRDLTILYLNSKQPNLYILTNDTKRTISEAYAQWKPKNK